ncbi:hypothetical protein F4815DRAFT_208304 [Daldinia loculata]|nr:hypothetical protein F4815DRAFT_208304 [Daldinia loculata]
MLESALSRKHALSPDWEPDCDEFPFLGISLLVISPPFPFPLAVPPLRVVETPDSLFGPGGCATRDRPARYARAVLGSITSDEFAMIHTMIQPSIDTYTHIYVTPRQRLREDDTNEHGGESISLPSQSQSRRARGYPKPHVGHAQREFAPPLARVLWAAADIDIFKGRINEASEPFYLSWIYLTHLTLLDVGVILFLFLFFFLPPPPPVPSPRCGPYPIVLLALGVLR